MSSQATGGIQFELSPSPVDIASRRIASAPWPYPYQWRLSAEAAYADEGVRAMIQALCRQSDASGRAEIANRALYRASGLSKGQGDGCRRRLLNDGWIVLERRGQYQTADRQSVASILRLEVPTSAEACA